MIIAGWVASESSCSTCASPSTADVAIPRLVSWLPSLASWLLLAPFRLLQLASLAFLLDLLDLFALLVLALLAAVSRLRALVWPESYGYT